MNSDQADILDLLAGHTDDSTIERLAFECLMTNLTDDRVASLMNVLGWRGNFDCFAIGGTPKVSPASASLVARNAVHDLGGEHAIVGTYGSFLLVLVCQMGAATAEVTCTSVMPAFSEDEPVYLSPVRSGVVGASHVLRETLFSLQAAWVAQELFWSWLILLGVFIVDASVTLLRRLLQGYRVYEAHRSHAYQHAARQLGRHLPVTLAVAVINLCWLLPLSLWAARGGDGFFILLLAYAPLILLALHYRAGLAD